MRETDRVSLVGDSQEQRVQGELAILQARVKELEIQLTLFAANAIDTEHRLKEFSDEVRRLEWRVDDIESRLDRL